jgi:hypothetical protein
MVERRKVKQGKEEKGPTDMEQMEVIKELGSLSSVAAEHQIPGLLRHRVSGAFSPEFKTAVVDRGLLHATEQEGMKGKGEDDRKKRKEKKRKEKKKKRKETVKGEEERSTEGQSYEGIFTEGGKTERAKN